MCHTFQSAYHHHVLRHIRVFHGINEVETCRNRVVVDEEILTKMEQIEDSIYEATMGMVPQSVKVEHDVKNLKWEWDTAKNSKVNASIGAAKVKCPFCAYSVAIPSHMARHIMTMHEEKRPFRKSLVSYIIL